MPFISRADATRMAAFIDRHMPTAPYTTISDVDVKRIVSEMMTDKPITIGVLQTEDFGNGRETIFAYGPFPDPNEARPFVRNRIIESDGECEIFVMPLVPMDGFNDRQHSCYKCEKKCRMEELTRVGDEDYCEECL